MRPIVTQAEQYPARTAEVRGKLGGVAADEHDYRGDYTSPSPTRGAPLHDLDPRYHEDLNYYVNRGHGNDVDTMDAITKARGNPDHPVTVYRTMPPEHSGQINTGDWVTTSYDYAKDHGSKENRGVAWPVFSTQARAGDLYNDGNSLQEYGYHGPSTQGIKTPRRPRRKA